MSVFKEGDFLAGSVHCICVRTAGQAAVVWGCLPHWVHLPGGNCLGGRLPADRPTRGSMQQMLNIAYDYAAEVRLQFSTDPDPAKSKSKVVFMVGCKRDLVKPAPLLLSG